MNRMAVARFLSMKTQSLLIIPIISKEKGRQNGLLRELEWHL
jgi:hypothetical protein